MSGSKRNHEESFGSNAGTVVLPLANNGESASPPKSVRSRGVSKATSSSDTLVLEYHAPLVIAGLFSKAVPVLSPSL